MKVLLKIRDTEEEIDVEENATVANFKHQIAVKHKVEAEQICLVFSGKILEDRCTLDTYHIESNHVLHLVIKPLSQHSDIDVDAKIKNILISLFGLELTSTTLSEILGKAKEVLKDPNFFQQVKEASVKYLRENPSVLYTILIGNPRINDMVQKMPQLNHLLSNPKTLRQALDLASKPSLLPEIIRNSDRAINNLESLPGGFYVLERIYNIMEQPLFPDDENIADNLFENDPVATTNPQLGTENKEPLPNPWANATNKVDDLFPAVKNVLRALNIHNGEELFETFFQRPKSSSTEDATEESSHVSPTSNFDASSDISAILKERYEQRLERLLELGFLDKKKNLKGLLLNSGDVDATVEWLTKTGDGEE